jgi:hypothetical protein
VICRHSKGRNSGLVLTTELCQSLHTCSISNHWTFLCWFLFPSFIFYATNWPFLLSIWRNCELTTEGRSQGTHVSNTWRAPSLTAN